MNSYQKKYENTLTLLGNYTIFTINYQKIVFLKNK